MKKLFILMLFIVLCLPLERINAYYCTYSETTRLKKIASNINISYTYDEKTNGVDFSITLVNLHPDLYLVDATNDEIISYTNSEVTISGYKGGETVQYKVYTVVPFCEGTVLTTLRITLPSYNSFYKDNLCEGISSYSLCQKWSSHGLSYDDFVKRVTQYRNSLGNSEPTIEEPEITSIWEIILDVFRGYYYIIYGVIIVGAGTGIFLLYRREKKIF